MFDRHARPEAPRPRASKRPRAGILVVTLTLVFGASLAAATPPGTISISTPDYPIFATNAYGSIWVGAHHGGSVYRISPATNTVIKTVPFGATPCGEPAVGFGSVFVENCQTEGDNTLEISAKTNKVVRTFRGGSPVTGDGSLWTLTPDGAHVLRLDPKTGVKLASIPTQLDDGVGGGMEEIGVAGGGAVWVGDQLTSTVVRIDAGTNKVVAVIPLPGAATYQTVRQGYAAGARMVFAGGKVWYGNPAGVFEIDPVTNTATLLKIKIGNLAFWGDIGFATGDGSVWVRNSGTTVTRIDPHTGNVIGSYPATGGGGGISIAHGSLWVANAGSDTTWRISVK